MNDDINKLWNEALEVLKDELSPVALKTYINVMEPYLQDSNTICLVSTSDYHREICKSRYLDLIQNTILYLTNKNYTILLKSKDESEIETATNPSTTPVYSDSELRSFSPRNASAECLNPKYTFENYIIGTNNRFAYSAALSISENPGKQFNPLFIYGGVGLGKTHLMQAMGHAMYQTNPDIKIMYATGEQFFNDFISSIMSNNHNLNDNKNELLRNKYRGADVLLIDDIQFLVGKDKCQEQFFHTFNALFESGKQIVLTSEKPPKDIIIDDRLKSRFEVGLAVDIQSPDFETRLAILKKKAQAERYIVDDDILIKIATRVRSNIRELEGVFNKLVAYTAFTKHELTSDVVENIIESILVKNTSILTSKLIMQVVAKFYNVKVDDLKSGKRSNSVAFPRQIAMYLCRESANMSFANIGKEFGGRDHSTVLHAYTKVKDEISKNPETYDLVEDIKKALSIDN
ncbi:MAG: chromosomal replication initiator protein DnaA [Clostridia bacterium]